MSVQIFLQGKIHGIDEFLLGSSTDFDGRSHWVSLLSEVLPRALLAELGLAKILLGASGAGQFLVVLPREFRSQADEFLARSAGQIDQLSGGLLKLLWVSTENLGDWSIVRKRLNDAMQSQLGAPAQTGAALFEPFSPDESSSSEAAEYFGTELGIRLRETQVVGWSPERPGVVQVGEGKHTWSLSALQDGIPFARHYALSDDGMSVATPARLGARSKGRPLWGVLRGDVDNFGVRLRRAQSIEEHIQLSVMYKQFFAGELEVLCSLPEFWRKVTLLFSGGDDFAVYGAWDTLIALAREVQRLFVRFAENNLKDFPGPEGKTISMAMVLARGEDEPLATAFEEAGQRLEMAKSSGKDCIWLLGRTLEWKQVADSSDTKDTMARMVSEFNCPPQFLYELASFYRDSSPMTKQSTTVRARNLRVEKPWRFHRRLNMVIETPFTGRAKNQEFERLRTELISEFTGRRAAQIRLRPAGRVALEWARLETEA
jgi:CRISPR-associated protein Csm1